MIWMLMKVEQWLADPRILKCTSLALSREPRQMSASLGSEECCKACASVRQIKLPEARSLWTRDEEPQVVVVNESRHGCSNDLEELTG